MRTPAPEVVLAEFHRQKALLAAAGALLQVEGRLDGKVDAKAGAKENTDANTGAETTSTGGVWWCITSVWWCIGYMCGCV